MKELAFVAEGMVYNMIWQVTEESIQHIPPSQVARAALPATIDEVLQR